MTAYIYLSNQQCQTAGQVFDLDHDGGLPPIKTIMEQLDLQQLGDRKLAVLLQDDLLHPLRIDLDQKVSNRELPQFLSWKLKRFLPWPIDDVALRYLPLQEDNAWLTFSLPKPWVTALFDAFKSHEIHCGYIGGLVATLMENQPDWRGSRTLAFFGDFYLYTELDRHGNYQAFKTRRLPYAPGGRLDTETLIHSDLTDFAGDDLRLMSFAPDLDGELDHIIRAMNCNGASQPAGKNALSRFHSCTSGGVSV